MLRMAKGVYFSICALCATLLLTVGVCFLHSNNLAAAPTVDAAARILSSSSVSAAVTALPAVGASTGETAFTPSATAFPAAAWPGALGQTDGQTDRVIGSAAAATKAAASGAKASEAAKAKPAPADTYEVTAYFLNVRANAYAKSKIIDVVKKGDILDVIKKTDNGWLLLKGGGYVHGGYAKRIDRTGETPPAVGLSPASSAPAHSELKSPAPSPSSPSSTPSKPKKPTNKVQTKSGLTAEHIETIFEGTALAHYGLEEVILEIEEQYGINAFFTIAVMKLESGNGKSSLARKKNNLFGLNASGGEENKRAFAFKTKEECVKKFGQLIAKNYIGKGYTTVDKIARKYCPANPKWTGLVSKIMQRDYKKL